MKIRYLIFILCMSLCLFSGGKLLHIYAGYRQGEMRYEALTSQFAAEIPRKQTERLPAPAAGTLPAPTEAPAAETAPIAVDFASLLELCPDVVGWIYCPDTPIHYPVVQAGDNRFYLDRLLDGTRNSSGSIFMDYRSTPDVSGWNTVLYGHNMKNGSMFGTLEEYKNQEYYEAHPVMYLLTPGQNYRIDLLGGYTTTGDDTNSNGFPSDQAGRDQLIATVQKRTTFFSSQEAEAGEKLITLSTCAYDYDGARYVLLGVLRPLA